MQGVKDYMGINQNDQNELKKNYIEEMKNKDFKELVNTIDKSDEVLMKYTSSLKDASVEFHNCLNCPGIENCKNNISGYCYTPISNPNSISFDYLACRYKKALIKEEKYMENIELFEASKALRSASLKNVKTSKERIDVIKYFKDFLDKYESKPVKGLYLNGNFGSGKTYLVAALLNELAKRNIKSAICYYPELLRSMKASFDSSEYNDIFNYVRHVPVLLIDDIGAEVVTPWSRDEILGSILQYRLENELVTFFTSNLTLDELEEHLALSSKGVDRVKARRIMERVKALTIDMKLIGIDRRKS